MSGVDARAAGEFTRMWAELEGVGRNERGTYDRLAWTPVDLELRAWFRTEVARRGLTLHEDAAGNLWGWWTGVATAERPGVATGSHLDSVPGGGAFDGPLGVVSALAAIDALRERGLVPAVPLGVVCSSDEEGGRFGIACVGTRVLTGVLAPEVALALPDDGGTTLGEALATAPGDRVTYGPDPDLLAGLTAFVELHVEQGRYQDRTGDPLAVATHLWPHGRWRVVIEGSGNHAGTTPLADRDDPMLTLAALITGARAAAQAHDAVATVGKVEVTPNGTNVIPARVTAWLDVRAPQETAVLAVLADLAPFAPQRESWSGTVTFDPVLRDRVAGVLGGSVGRAVPALGTGAGHDAGILQSAGVASAMIFVRNPSGISHAAGEGAGEADCLLGVSGLADVLADLTGVLPAGGGARP